MSLSLGRPVHMDHVSLNLLPLPSLTIDNLVVEEDPSFGSEPIIRSSSVTARLRVSSLWRKQLEFSRISFLDPSINLVHNPDGRWNVENVLLQAARIEAAPTDQRRAGAAPRFPYIEATGARLNLKRGREKLPFSLSEADFALWLPSPRQWKLRLKAKPVRTDLNASDTGSVLIEGTLGRPAISGPVLVKLEGAWRNVPMGEASRLLIGGDAGLRGNFILTTALEGTLEESTLKTNLHIDDLRRSEFVPEQAITVDLECLAQARQSFHSIEAIRCGWPLAGARPGSTLALTGSIPDVRRPGASNLQIGSSGIAASTLLGWMRVASNRIAAGVVATGVLTGSVQHESSGPPSLWSGQISVKDLHLAGPGIGKTPVDFGDATVQVSGPSEPASQPLRRVVSLIPTFTLAPTELPLGGKEPALLEGRLDGSGYHLHLSGTVVVARVLAFADAIPQFGEGLRDELPDTHGLAPVHLDLSSSRLWGGPQTWIDTVAPAKPLTAPFRQRPETRRTPDSEATTR